MAFTIPPAELEFRASRAGGPGGQHVNKASTRIEVRWDIEASPSLTPTQRSRLRARLGRRIDAGGVLRVTADERRSQLRNREAALTRLTELVQRALQRPTPRQPTTPPPRAREARLRAKAHRARRKRERSPTEVDD